MTTNNASDIIIYQSPDGSTSLEVHLDHETVWLTQMQMAELFDKDSDTIGLHIRNTYKEGELRPEGTTEESSVVRGESLGASGVSETTTQFAVGDFFLEHTA